MKSVFIALAVASMALAGCTTDSHEHAEVTLATTGLPAQAFAGIPVTFTVTATEEGDHRSDHIGAHYWTEAPADPTAALSTSTGCAHISAAALVAGDHEVTCTFAEAGTYHVYGHVRITEDEDVHDFWAPVKQVIVQEPYTLTVTPSAASGDEASFNLNVTGPDGKTNHVGGHVWSQQQSDPTAAIGDSVACAHVPGDSALPLVADVTCDLSAQDDGTYYVYGHLRVVVGGVTYDFWAEPYTHIVGAAMV